MIEPKPHRHQVENHLIDDGVYWEKVGSATWDMVESAVDDVKGGLWIDGRSSGRGSNDEVEEAHLDQLGSSLCLIRPKQLKVIAQTEGGGLYPAKIRTRARFDYKGVRYRFGVTDPVIESRCKEQIGEVLSINEAVICVSLAELFEERGCAYKLVAGVITPDMAD